MSELGKKLKAIREEKGISLQEIGLALKISPRIISSIESGEKAGQPAKTFLRGFVKSYAQYLKVDTGPILEMFDSEYSMEPVPNKTAQMEKEESLAPGPKAVAPAKNSSEPAVRTTPFPSFPWGKALLAAFLFVGIVILAKVVHKYQKERDLPTSENPEVLAPVTETTAGTEESPLTPVLDPGATPAVTTDGSTEVSSAPVATPTPEEAVATPSPTPSPSPSPSPTATPTPSPTPTPTPSPSPSPTAAPKVSSGERFELLVEATKNAAVTFDLGSGKITSVEMKRGDVQIFKSRSPITIETSDGSALSVFVNGRIKPKSGSQPLKLRIPE